MKILHNIGTEKHSNYNTIEQILACNDGLSFDGVYESVYEHRNLLKGVTLFVCGNTIGGDNTFDLANVPKLEKFCTLPQLYEMELMGMRIGWHTKTHKDLTTLDDDEIRDELGCPFKFEKILAYPYGKFNDKVIEIVREMGYKAAYSVTEGDNSQYQLLRSYL